MEPLIKAFQWRKGNSIGTYNFCPTPKSLCKVLSITVVKARRLPRNHKSHDTGDVFSLSLLFRYR